MSACGCPECTEFRENAELRSRVAELEAKLSEPVTILIEYEGITRRVRPDEMLVAIIVFRRVLRELYEATGGLPVPVATLPIRTLDLARQVLFEKRPGGF